MMDTAKLLAELDASDAIRRKATIASVGFGENPHDIIVQCYGNDRNDNLDAVRQATIDSVRYAQQLREALSRIAELEAIVDPLERLLDLQGKYPVREVLIQHISNVLIPSVFSEFEVTHIGHHGGATLAEALAAAADKAMEDGT